MLLPDTIIKVNHGKNSKRLIVTAKTEDGKIMPLKYKKVNANQIKILSRVDTTTKVKLTVLAKEPLENQGWYKTMQAVARTAMMVRNISFTYRNNYQLTLPGFLPTIGDAFGQTKQGVLSPGLDFAFGMVDDSYIDKERLHRYASSQQPDRGPATASHSRAAEKSKNRPQRFAHHDHPEEHTVYV